MRRIDKMVTSFDDFVNDRQLSVRLIGGKRDCDESLVEIHDDLVFNYCGLVYVVPSGFTCDGCSVPEIFQAKIKKINPRYLFAYVVHDYFYSTRQIPRALADEILLWMLRGLDAPRIRRFNVYLRVRMFGWMHWK